MSAACGRPQGGSPAHVDRGEEGVKNLIFCGHHKWIAPNCAIITIPDCRHPVSSAQDKSTPIIERRQEIPVKCAPTIARNLYRQLRQT